MMSKHLLRAAAGALLLASSASAQNPPLPSQVFIADHLGGDNQFGAAVGAYDRDGDGLADLVVGIPGAFSGDGRVKILSGAGGLLLDIAAQAIGEGLGAAVIVVPDFTGDSAPDLIVGSSRGRRVYFYDGQGNGTPVGSVSEPLMPLYGTVLASAGDVDGNGVQDLIVGAPGTNMPGAAYVYALPSGQLLHTISDGLQIDGLGASAAGTGDLDGDGRGDFIIGAPGSVFVPGKATVYSGMTGQPLQMGGTTLSFTRGINGDALGMSVAYLKNNVNGKPRFLVGVPDNNVLTFDRRGSVIVYTTESDQPRLTISGDLDFGRFGQRLLSVGDLNFDGIDDFVVSSERYSMFGSDAGFAAIYSGADFTRILFVSGRETNARTGSSIAVGDLDGDTLPDLILGEPLWGGGLVFPDDDRGRVAMWSSSLFSSSPFETLCSGDGSAGVSCPCGNQSGSPNEGCFHGGGSGLTLTASGSTSISADTLTLTVGNPLVGEPGFFIASKGSRAPLKVMDGLLCLDGPAFRFASGTGVMAQDVTNGYYFPGDRVVFQYYMRDSFSPPCGFGGNFSPAVSLVLGL